MNILIVASYYEQDKNIASVRWTNFAQRLAKRHRIYVLAEPLPESANRLERYTSSCGVTVMRMEQTTLYEKFSRLVKRQQGSATQTPPAALAEVPATILAGKWLRKIKNRLGLAAEYILAKQQQQFILRHINQDHIKFDVVISSVRPFRQFLLGAMLTKMLDCAWISDFRDLPFSNWSDPDDIALQSKLLRTYTPLAAATTLVSQGMCEAFIELNNIPEPYAKKVYVLSNGFSEADASCHEPVRSSNTWRLNIGYTGDLYAGRRDAGLLFTAIAELMAEGKIALGDIGIEYAGSSGAALLQMANAFGLSSIVHDHGFIARSAALTLQNQADLLLLLTWNTHLVRGMLTGKMYEYILCKKPIICITSGDLPAAEASSMIRKYRLGIACETVTFTEDVAALKQYLLRQLTCKRLGKALEYHADDEALQEFNHDKLAVKLENLCMEAVKEKGNAYLPCSSLVSGK